MSGCVKYENAIILLSQKRKGFPALNTLENREQNLTFSEKLKFQRKHENQLPDFQKNSFVEELKLKKNLLINYIAM